MRLLFPLLLYCCSVLAAADLSQLRYLTEEYPPYNFSLGQGQVSGFTTDILHLVWREMAVEPQPIEILPWARGYYLLASRDNVVLFSTARIDARVPLFQWACSLGTLELNLYAFKQMAPRLTRLDDAKRLVVVAVRDDVGELLLLSHGFNPGLLVRTSSLEQAIRVLSSGRANLLSSNRLTLVSTLKRQGYEPDMMAPLLEVSHKPLCFAFSAGIPAQLVSDFQAVLNRVLSSEEGRRLRQKYFDEETLLSVP
ncbi:transporter substrate-binding domain-containing protein [Shewanella indica]|uniref:Transporter substrate-binding domain-containing protein n=1 Tax=Shewanella indica TaxID=768528 RepID=A0ABU4Q7W7_9GAMM|nr:transporter substrate-binding domain-containing protein [Shewanella indica]MDX6015524.1 transporter substrate-binding domain-containing protein [Shewanella indica]